MRIPQALDGLLEGVKGHDLDRIERREAGIDAERFDPIGILGFNDPQEGVLQRRVIPRLDPLNAVLFGELRRIGFGDGHEDPGVVGNVDRTDFRLTPSQEGANRLRGSRRE